MKNPDQVFKQLAALYEFQRNLKRYVLPEAPKAKAAKPAPPKSA